MSRYYQIVRPGAESPYWRGDRQPQEDEIEEMVGKWESGLVPMEVPQIVTDYLLVQRHTIMGWKTIQTICLFDSLEATPRE